MTYRRMTATEKHKQCHWCGKSFGLDDLILESTEIYRVSYDMHWCSAKCYCEYKNNIDMYCDENFYEQIYA